MNFEKDLQLERLHRENESLKAEKKNFVGAKPEAKFSDFSNEFEPDTLKKLRSLRNDPSSDRTFIRMVLESLYPNAVSVENKSLFGCPSKTVRTKSGEMKVTTEKLPLTPEKVDVLHKIYSERMKAAELGEAEYIQRTNRTYVNQLIATGLSNYTRSKNNVILK